MIQLMMFFLPPPNGSTLLKSRRPSRAVNGSILGWYESILTNLSYWQVVPVPGYFRTTIEGAPGYFQTTNEGAPGPSLSATGDATDLNPESVHDAPSQSA